VEGGIAERAADHRPPSTNQANDGRREEIANSEHAIEDAQTGCLSWLMNLVCLNL
jgi:hypothetical protein